MSVFLRIDDAQMLKRQTDAYYQAYVRSVANSNSLIQRRQKTFGSLMDSMAQIEESRAAFLKGLINKHLKHTEEIARMYLERNAVMADAAAKIDSEGDIKRYMEAQGAAQENNPFEALKCTQYEYSNKMILLEEEKDAPGSTAASGDSKSIGDLLQESLDAGLLLAPPQPAIPAKFSLEQAFINLQDGKEFSLDEKATIVEQLNTEAGRANFIQLLSQFTYSSVLMCNPAFHIIGEFCNHVLTVFATKKEATNFVILQTLLVSSRKLSTKVRPTPFMLV